MSFVVHVFCEGKGSAATHRRTHVRAISHINNEFWLPRAEVQTSQAQTSGADALIETLPGQTVSVYEELYGTKADRSTGETRLKFDLECDHPLCGLRLHRRYEVVAPLLDRYREVDHAVGESFVALKHLVRLVSN